MSKLAIEGGEPAVTEPLPTIKNRTGRRIGDEEMAQVREVVESGTLAYIYGTKVKQFERDFAEMLGVRHAVACSSGTAALHTAVIYLNPEPGDEIIVSPITDMGTVIPILYQMAVPVFADVDPETQNLDPAKVQEQITDRTRAIMVTHIYGGPAEMDPITEIAERHGLFVIEDCAQAHGATYKGRYVGTIGDISCFSFQQSKHITTGDGGMVVANEDGRFGRALRLCADKGWPREKPGRDHCFLAPNYHMTELQAAVGIAQVPKYPEIVAARRRAAAQMDDLTAGLDGVRPVGTLPDCEHTYFYYCLRLDAERFGVEPDRIAEALGAEGLGCEWGYPGPVPLYLYDLLRERKTFGSSGWPLTLGDGPRQDFGPGLCPEAERACRETIVLPWNEGLESRHVEMIFAALGKVINAYLK